MYRICIKNCKDEKEIRCCTLDYCDKGVADCLSTLRDADQKAGDIAKNIIQLKERLNALQNVCKHLLTVERVNRYALLNFVDAGNHEYDGKRNMRFKITINENDRRTPKRYRQGFKIGEND